MASPIAMAMVDLGIETHDMLTDPKSFIRRIVNKANWLENQIKKPNTISTIEEEFKANAVANSEAQEKANEVINQIMTLVFEQDVETVVCILTKMSEVTSTANNMVKAMAIRQTNTETYTKRELHEMYKALKQAYETYIQFMRAFQDGPAFKAPPVIKGLPGNYTERSNSGTKTYIWEIDGEEYHNPFTVARILGINQGENKRVTFYTDLLEIAQSGEFTNLSFREA